MRFIEDGKMSLKMKRKLKKMRYMTVKPPKGYRLVRYQYLGNLHGREVDSIRVFFEKV